MPVPHFVSWTVAVLALVLWVAPAAVHAQDDDQPDANDQTDPPAANEESEETDDGDAAQEEEEPAEETQEPAEEDDEQVPEEQEPAPAENDEADAPANDEPLVEPHRRTAELDERWQRFSGPYFNRAPVRSYAGAMARWSAQIDSPSFGQISFEAWTEFSPFDVEEFPFAFLAHWGISIGYASNSASFLQTVQPIYLGAKFNLVSDEEYYFSAATLFGFIDDNVSGEYNPMNLLPGLGDFAWDLRAMFSYALPDVDFAFNTEMVLHFNFGFVGNRVSLSWLFEAVYMFSTDFTLRGGFDFHTIASGVNLFAQGDFWLDEDFLLFCQFKGFLSGTGRVFDFALMLGATYHF